MEFTYTQFKDAVATLDFRLNQIGSKLKEYDVYRNSMGLLPDEIRVDEDYRYLKNSYQKQFNELRRINSLASMDFKRRMSNEWRNANWKKIIR